MSDKYQRVKKQMAPPTEGEIRVTATGRLGLYVTYGVKLLVEVKKRLSAVSALPIYFRTMKERFLLGEQGAR